MACRQFLESHRIAFQKKEIVDTPPSLVELKAMLKLKGNDIKKLFNTSGMLYREMQLHAKLPTMPTSEALELLRTHGMLVKRPFLIGGNIGLTGFRQAEWEKSLLTH